MILMRFGSYHSFYPDGPEKSDSLTKIVSERHTARIKGLIDATKGKIVIGGEADVSKRYIAPTIVRDVKPDDELMKEYVAHVCRWEGRRTNTIAAKSLALSSQFFRMKLSTRLSRLSTAGLCTSPCTPNGSYLD